ncbi:hypothetical protein [Fodinicola feengrottensis]|uniref:hypothetical protein n=1 Tax=Fodinicola feengrottensis TaxID=435914 RepID=UPI0031D1837E
MVADVVRCLVGVLDQADARGRTFDIGGPDVMSDLDMMRRVAVIEAGSFSCCRSRRCHRSFRRNWLALVTDVDVQAARALIDSMTNEGLVRDDTSDMSSSSARWSTTTQYCKRSDKRAKTRERMVKPWWRGQGMPRRRRVVAGTAVAGTTLLGLSLSTKPGSSKFYGITSVVAGIWLAGGLASGPLHRGHTVRGNRRPVMGPVPVGVGAFGAFAATTVVAR